MKKKSGMVFNLLFGLLLILVVINILKYYMGFDELTMILVKKSTEILLCLVIAYYVIAKATEKTSKEKELIKFTLSSRHFLYNLLILLGSIVWTTTIGLLFLPDANLPIKLILIPVLSVPLLFAKFEFVRKINLKAFDEREELLCLRAERIAGLSTAYSSVILLFLESNFVIQNMLMLVPFLIYYIVFNFACWYSYGKEEKSITTETKQ